MTTPDEKTSDTRLPAVAAPVPHAPTLPDTPPGPSIQAKAKAHHISVSAAVIEAARKDGDDLLKSLRTRAAGLTQSEAEDRIRETGPNAIGQAKSQTWSIRLLKILRNPL